MDDKNSKSQAGPISVVVALCAALGLLIYNQIPLKGVRPSVPEMPERSQKINARLWQDPFQAVLDQAKTKHAKPFGICIFERRLLSQILLLRREIEERLRTENVTVLGVMVPGTPYAEEIRLRYRYAVLSGLHMSSFVPKDPNHIGFISMFQSKKECEEAEEQISLSTILPFEWFDSKNDKGSVLLFWINDDVFQEKPLLKLGFWVRQFLVSQVQFPYKPPKFKVIGPKVIGPADPTTLQEMLKDLQGVADLRWLNGVEIYSAKATVEEPFLLKEEKPQKDAIANMFLHRGITFKQTICSDNELVQELIEELWNRGVSKGAQIALISERDTLYGRSLPNTFEKVLESDEFKGYKWKVHRFSYLRGVDGKLPRERDEAAKERQKNEGSRKEEEDLQDLEKPMGRSQHDYLRRLAQNIYERDQQLFPGKIQAIGVLGSDFYDKYLLLQALFQRFPDIYFFTTDLDAHFLHPASIKYTRNLIVASGFGLKLRDDLQGEVPDFRDVYQTSVFLATQCAFRSPDSYILPPKPLLFEIGRYNPIDLTTDPGKDRNPVHPPRQMPEFHVLPSIYFIIIISSSLLLLGFLSKTGMVIWQKVVINPVILISALVVLIAFFELILKKQSEEPFSLLEGISSWPMNILRLIAIFLSVFFIVYSKKNLKNSDQELGKEFALVSGPDNADKQQSHWKISSWYEEIRCKEDIDSQDWLSVNEKWKEYVLAGEWSFSRKRVALLTIICFFLCFFLIVFFGIPVYHVRGLRSRGITYVILFLDVVTLIYLIFFVFYSTALCRRFVTRFWKNKPRWKQESLDQFQERIGENWLSEWMLIRLVAKRTEVVGKMIYYPFIVLILMILSRLKYFDNIPIPIGLRISMFLFALLAWWCAFMLRCAAEKLRGKVVDRLAVGTRESQPPCKEYAERIPEVRNEIILEKRGAFAPYLQNPVLHSLLALGGYGSVQLFDFLGKQF